MTIPVETKDMKFKYVCKYCQKAGLAWKVIDHKWTLFDTCDTAHTCDEKKDKLSSQTPNLKKKKAVKKSPFKNHMEKLLDDKMDVDEKVASAKEIIKNIKKPIIGMDLSTGAVKSTSEFLKENHHIQSTGEFLKAKQEADSKKTNPKSNAPKVKLIDANELYQPVFGSSQNSTYYVVALYSGLKFAARVKGNGHAHTVSIRVEGGLYTQLKGMSGLQKFKDNGAYGSIHLNVETVYEAKMVICGLVGGLDLESLSPIPDLINIAK